MMDSEFNWTMRHQQIVENHFDMHIPPDITFQFEEDEKEIHAHKWMMGMVSPVFNKMFFVADTKDKDAKKLFMKGTTFGAFNITKNAIYGITSMQNGLKGKSVLEIFSVLDLVTRYQISELQQVVRKHLASFLISDDTVLEVAATALEKSSTFKAEAHQLLILCAKFLNCKFKSTKDVFKYVADHREDKDVVYELLALANDIEIGLVASPRAPVCANCRMEPCQHGVAIKNNQFREGLMLTISDHYWWEESAPHARRWGNGIVSQVQGESRVRVKSVKSGVNGFMEWNYDFMDMTYLSGYKFKFVCK